MLLARYCGMPAARLEFDYGPQGKPSFSRCSCPIRFNISHSGEIAAYAFTRGCAVGIDVERQRKLPDLEEIAKHYFSPAEYCELMTIPEHERAAAFYACWVRKEAFLKAKGGGLSIPLDSFQVSVAPDRLPAVLSVGGDAREARRWSLHEFMPAAGYSGAVVCEGQRILQVHALRSAREIVEAPTERGCGSRKLDL
jgi:4'-phosphopantetheinyl transferase